MELSMWKRTIVLLIIIYVNTTICIAQKYKITYLYPGSSITIGNKKMKVGDVFDGSLLIKWRPPQFMRVINLKTKKERYFCQPAFAKVKVTSIADYLVKEKTLYTRGLSTTHRHYTQIDHYLADSLHFSANAEEPNTIAESVWILNNEEIVVPIRRTDDGKFYIITPAIYAGNKPQDIKLDIRERSIDNNWIENVYTGIPIYSLIDNNN